MPVEKPTKKSQISFITNAIMTTDPNDDAALGNGDVCYLLLYLLYLFRLALLDILTNLADLS
jgi:hypothetical protein